MYHGMPLDLHTFREGPGNYLAFLGRVSPEKGLEQAVEIARRCRDAVACRRQDLPGRANRITRIRSSRCFERSPWVEFVGEVGGAAKDAFLGNAPAVLFPINWAEPFGLVMIEAMACGTPVVAFRRGSVPEVMIDGLTGFVVDDVEGAVEAVNESCRARSPGLPEVICRAIRRRADGARLRGGVSAACSRTCTPFAAEWRERGVRSGRIDPLP